MNIGATVLNDYQYWDDLEPVTLISDFAPVDGQSVGQTVTSAMRRAPTFKELAASNGAYTAQDLVWLLPSPLVNGIAKPGDLVYDAQQNTWTALEVSLDNVGSVWRMVTRNMQIVWQLRDTIDIEIAGDTYDIDGAVRRNWSKLYQAVSCRVQPQVADTAEARGMSGQQTKYTVFLSQQLVLDVRECRVFWAAGPDQKYLDILSYRNTQRIDELPILEAIGKV